VTALTTHSGVASVVAALVASVTRPQWVQYGVGSGQGASAVKLASPAQNRVVGITSQQTTFFAGDTYRITGTITADAVRDITEVGVFVDATGDTLAFYGDFDVVTVNNGDTIDFTIDVVME
jgi:D-arabinose 1-dehydrogenase-like Zn-dependent alcohol dehydrogenase